MNANCTVSDIMGTPNPGYGFDILNEREQPILSFAFERRDDAEHARVEVANAVARADLGCSTVHFEPVIETKDHLF